MTTVDVSQRISTAVVLNIKSKVTRTRVAYMQNDKIIGKGYDTSVGEGEKLLFISVDQARDWVHEIAPEGAEFKPNKTFSNDHYDNIGSNRRDFEEMWGIHHEPNETVRLLNGSETFFNRTVGYCAHHTCYLTKKQLQTKECLKKECKRLIKIEGVFWQERDAAQVEKRIKKALETI